MVKASDWSSGCSEEGGSRYGGGGEISKDGVDKRGKVWTFFQFYIITLAQFLMNYCEINHILIINTYLAHKSAPKMALNVVSKPWTFLIWVG